MAFAFGMYSEAQPGALLVPAQAGRIIRVLKLVLTTWGTSKFTLLSDPTGASVPLGPPWYLTAGAPLVIRLGRSFALATERGRALGIMTVFQMGPAEHSVSVWYEVVA